MDWDEYAEFVTQMASKDTMKSFESKLTTSGLGLAGEAGEVADLVKKVLFHSMEFTPDVREKLIKEVGDLNWYMTFLCKNVLDVTLDEVMEKNVAKLKDRYKTGTFTKEEFMNKENKK